MHVVSSHTHPQKVMNQNCMEYSTAQIGSSYITDLPLLSPQSEYGVCTCVCVHKCVCVCVLTLFAKVGALNI